jgi:hypothetical protein
MAPSVVSMRVFDATHADGNDIRSANTLGELCALLPGPYAPQGARVVNKVYAAAVKANHVRSYLASLERHRTEETFPNEIQGRLRPPVLQISKEYAATAAGKIHQTWFEKKVPELQRAALDQAIVIKQAELEHLQSLITTSSYKEEMQGILNQVTRELCADSGVALEEDDSIDTTKIPEFLKHDYKKMQDSLTLFPARALAIAHISIQREMTSKMKALTLKSKGDKDVVMTDDPGEIGKLSVAELVQQEIKRLRSKGEFASPASGPGPSFPSLRKRRTTETDLISEETRQCRTRSETQPIPQEKIPRRAEGQEQRRRKRKREWEEEISKEMKLLSRPVPSLANGRALGGTSGPPGASFGWTWGDARVPSGVTPERRGRRPFLGTLTKAAGRGRLINTPIAQSFLEKHSDLWNSVSERSRNKFILHHYPVSLAEYNHEFASGIFVGPGVSIPRDVEYDLANNVKFILHQPPDVLRVQEAWKKLERSVRIRWHFRDSDSQASKFYVAKREWQPPLHLRDPVIERGLAAGKDLLFSQVEATVLLLRQSRRPNPGLTKINDFLRQSQSLVKITDKNLGVAVLAKDWYLEQCERHLRDRKTYALFDPDELPTIRSEVLENISNLPIMFDLPKQVCEFLLSSPEDVGIPQFHCIPKVHKTEWSLRPIIPSHSWVTKKSSQVADFLLRQCLKEAIPWCVESTREVMQRLEALPPSLSDQVWLVTGDVGAFYTNVPIDETIENISNALGDKSFEGIPTDMLDSLLRIVMKNNVFEFNGTFYHQVEGVAMGTSCAPAFANLSLGFKERASGQIVVGDTGLRFYVRYMDDIFLIWSGTRSSLDAWLGRFTPQLAPYRITWDIRSSSQATPFLDAEFFYRASAGLWSLHTKVYRKRMNKHQYIPWSSAHPETVKRAFVKAELTRFMIICSQEESFEERVREFYEALARRGYPAIMLRKWRKMVAFKDRPLQLLKKKDSAPGLPLMLPSSYDEIWEYVDVKSVLTTMKNHWKTRGPIPESLNGPLIKSLRRTENLFDKISAWNKAILRDDGRAPPFGEERRLESAGVEHGLPLRGRAS